MKKTILSLMILAAVPAALLAEKIVDDVTVSNFQTERDGSHLRVNMDLGLQDLKVKSNQCVLLTPRLVNGNDSIDLPSVAIYGRQRYYYYLRNQPDSMMSGKAELSFRAKDKPAEIAYNQLFTYEDWMDGARITMQRTDRGCCQKLLLQEYGEIGRYRAAFFPDLIYVHPKGVREKRRSLEGQAFIDFPVDQTVIYPDYRSNQKELAKIIATIDTIRNDKDARIDTVWLKGFASPESPYKHNTDLAIGRTKALKEYIEQLYNFNGVTMLTDYEPEDWEGLREAVDKSNIDHRTEILALIDSDMEPDAKEAKIKRLYPKEYRFMLTTFYPPLRHTNYKVSYVIRTYSDPKEILKIMHEAPQKLDQNEFYVAASEFEPGSDEFTEVFETAVKMFPSDEAANINAANAAMRKGDNAAAAKYLKKAGNSAEAIYSRGALAIREKEYEKAKTYLQEAADMGLEQAKKTLRELNEGRKK